MKVDEWVKKIAARDRSAIARAFTAVESVKPEHEREAIELIEKLEAISQARPIEKKPLRVAITGLPGAGKSTLIEALGRFLTAQKKTVAVLAIDPTSPITGGSILGDKTRMVELAQDPLAFIRPSPSGAFLGGVSPRTRRALAICEGAGFDVILVETVGVGQSEAKVAEMVDLVLLTLIGGAGDELQGIKRGLLEMADLIAINKADGAQTKAAEITRSEYENASHISGKNRKVLLTSALEKRGIDALWAEVESLRQSRIRSGDFLASRSRQRLSWMWDDWMSLLQTELKENPEWSKRLKELEERVSNGTLSPPKAAKVLLENSLQKI